MFRGASARRLGSVLAVAQGLLAALFPGASIAVTKRLIGKNFANADALEARPAYRRQVRALGVGLAAAGVAGYAMESVAADERDAADEGEAASADRDGDDAEDD